MDKKEYIGNQLKRTFHKKYENYCITRIIHKLDNEYIQFITQQFPKWKEAWQNCNNEEYDGKYIYVYMGFGNGLSVDKSIYREYEPYLLDEVKKIKNKHNEKEGSSSMYYPAWKPAVENMLNNK